MKWHSVRVVTIRMGCSGEIHGLHQQIAALSLGSIAHSNLFRTTGKCRNPVSKCLFVAYTHIRGVM